MDKQFTLDLVIELLRGVNPDDVSTIQINQSDASNGYQGYTIDVVFSEPNSKQVEDAQTVEFYT